SFSVSIWGILLVQLAAESQDGHQRGGDGGNGVDEDREPKRAYAEGRENEQYDFYQRGSAGSGVREHTRIASHAYGDGYLADLAAENGHVAAPAQAQRIGAGHGYIHVGGGLRAAEVLSPAHVHER